MKKIIVVGCGFAGISAVRKLHGLKNICVTVIEKRKNAVFLPLLPDIVGREIGHSVIEMNIEEFCVKHKVKLINDEVASISPESGTVMARRLELTYDYLLLACGTETNFYNNNQIPNAAFKMDDTGDMLRMLDMLKQNKHDAVVVAGGGYTGVEIATAINAYYRKHKINKPICMIDPAQTIMAMVPEWMRNYTCNNLSKLGIEVRTGLSVKDYSNNRITFSDGSVINNSVLIWAAGVRSPDIAGKLSFNKSRQGRLYVDEFLRVDKNVFAAGDCAAVKVNSGDLRMAVQFAITQGGCAAGNILRSIKGESLRKYKPLDLGYIVPMANNKACGVALGVGLKGFPAILPHYFMCIYRLYGIKNKFKLLAQLIKSEFN